MPIKNKKSRKILKKIILYCFISFLGISYIEQATAGGGYSDYSDALIDGLIEYLTKHNNCGKIKNCEEIFDMRSEGEKTIYINMYGQSDATFISDAVVFFIKDGLKISKNTPITLSIYPYAHEKYSELKYSFISKKTIIKLEIKNG